LSLIDVRILDHIMVIMVERGAARTVQDFHHRVI
jgi:hypothetical protein